MIAVDAMGGDFAPQAVVQGAYQAACRGIAVTLYGDKVKVEQILKKVAAQQGIDLLSLPLFLVHTSQIIPMGQEPSRAVVHLRDSSLVRAVQDVAEGKAQAVVSAGNSGACLVAGTLILGRVPGIDRPAIGEFLPTNKDSIFCLDLGANVDCKPEYLEQFARMGHVYVKLTKGIENPRIALLSNGEEPYKGSLNVKSAYALLQSSDMNFIGNLQARDIFDDHADVLVCDGFVGNILLKALQGTTKTMVAWIHQARKKSLLSTIGLFLSRGLFKSLKAKIDYAKKGGALLLGVNHPLIIAHGCSNAQAIENAIIFAHNVVQNNIIQKFNAELASKIAALESHGASKPINSYSNKGQVS